MCSYGDARFPTVRLANKLSETWVEASGTPTEMNFLATHPELVRDFLDIIRGTSQKFKYVVDADKNPLPYNWEDWEIVSHRPQGVHTWSPELFMYVDVLRHFGEAQLNAGLPIAKLLEEREYETDNFANTCFVKFLVRHKGLVPKEWRKFKRLFFLGTVFVSPHRHQKEIFFYDGNRGDFERWEVQETYLHEGDFLAILKR